MKLLLISGPVLRARLCAVATVPAGPSGQKWLTAAELFAGGYPAGGLIMGCYLYISLRFFRRHANEAFSALRIADYKNFVRLHIDPNGKLTNLAIGVKKGPRR